MDKVIIVEYNPQWPLLFDREAERIRNVVDGDLINRIEHFGSTAVPGLAAKPIIDLLVGVHSLVQAKQIAISQLQTLDYAYWYDNPDPQQVNDFIDRNLDRDIALAELAAIVQMSSSYL
jgi:GrpB-like predicted nucleotidyltransferase (UPF0157 family)